MSCICGPIPEYDNHYIDIFTLFKYFQIIPFMIGLHFGLMNNIYQINDKLLNFVRNIVYIFWYLYVIDLFIKKMILTDGNSLFTIIIF